MYSSYNGRTLLAACADYRSARTVLAYKRKLLADHRTLLVPLTCTLLAACADHRSARTVLAYKRELLIDHRTLLVPLALTLLAAYAYSCRAPSQARLRQSAMASRSDWRRAYAALPRII